MLKQRTSGPENSWASMAAGTGRGGRGTRGTKVEIFQDPRSYDGLASKFEEWWMKLNAWLDCHPKQFSEKDLQGHEVPTLKPQMYAVLSHLKGSKGAHYTKMELKKLADGKLLHWYWELFTMEIEGVFRPQLQQDWACNTLKKLKQTDNMSMVAFIAEFMKLKPKPMTAQPSGTEKTTYTLVSAISSSLPVDAPQTTTPCSWP